MLALAFLVGQSVKATWIEAEKPTSSNVKYGTGAPGRAELLSGGKWLSLSIDANTALPDGEARFTYEFRSESGRRELWHRVGFEAARAPFEWRIDDGSWHAVSPNTHTTDLTELADWNGVAWMDMGSVELGAGTHTLSIRIPRPTDGNGKPKSILYGSDAFALVEGEFIPNGKWRPDEDWRTDRDRAAANRMVPVPATPGPNRATVSLGGDWEIARDDELQPALVGLPMRPLRDRLAWSAIAVPGDKAELRPDLTLAHRVWYRTRIDVPKSAAGRSFSLTFHQNSLNTTVLVNGQACGFNPNPFVKWSCDVTSAIHPGANEIMVGIRDAWYGYHQDPRNPAAIWSSFAIPASFSHMGFSRLDFPVWGCFKSGLLDTPELVVGGRTFASDVFVKPSVSKKRLDASVKIRSDVERSAARIVAEVVDPESGKVVQKIADQTAPVKPGETAVELGGPWANPTLWWPDRPKMYTLRVTTLDESGPIDVSETPFGFREWTVDGPRYLLNGIVWHGWAELVQGDRPEAWLANYRKTDQRFQRMSGPAQNGGGIRWLGMPYDQALDWCDRNGVTIRRCGPLDGEAIGYMAIDDAGGINKTLLENVRKQMIAQVLGERNHPSVNMWSVENEWLYINCINLYGGLMDDFERDMAETINAVRKVDPTRLAMTDGGGAGKGSILPVHGDHYVYTNQPNDYPTLAYQDQPNGGGRGRWTWDGKRPRYAGEDYFATGINPADYAWIEGEEAFGGKTEAHRGMAMVQRMVTEGYRWGGAFTAFHLWIGDEGKEFYDKYVANAERAVFVRQQDSAFASGAQVVRTLGVFNDSRFDDPLTVDWSLNLGSKPVSRGSKTLTVHPGTKETFDVPLRLPVLATKTPLRLFIGLRANGKTVFTDTKSLSVFPERTCAATGLGVYDPGGTVSRYLVAHKVAFRPLSTLSGIDNGIKTILVGPNAISESASSDPALSALAYDGKRVIVLEQSHPLHFGALPTDLELADGGGAYGYVEDTVHPALQGIANEDLRAWGPSARLYDQAYRKSTRGIRSLIQVGPRLSETAMAEVPVGKGVMLLCQLRVGQNLAGSGAARWLLAGLINYASTYRRIDRKVVAATDDPNFAKALDATGVRRTDVKDPIAALDGAGVAIVSATPDNLRKLSSNLEKVRAFTARGGALVLNGLTPAGLADYNRLVGVEHIIRPFRREKTALATPRDPLATGMTQGDVVMYSGERMFSFNEDMFVASDIFNYIVDVDDVAPFATLPNDELYNTVNGFVSADGWKYIYSFSLPHGKPEYTMSFPKAMSFREVTWIGNAFYHKVSKFSLSFDGGPPVVFNVAPNNEPQTLAIEPPRSGKQVRLSILEWTKETGITEVVGIDNISLRVARPSDWKAKVRPILNVGGIVRYPQGNGAIVLVNLAFRDRESVPINATKKRAILASVLRNLGAGFSGGANVVVAGAKGILYTPVSLAGKATAFRNEKGWFGDAKRTLADLPTGRQVFGSVPFDVYDFPTSPVPTAVVLGGPGVPGGLPERVDGIPVGLKASALFFLHTARIDRRLDPREKREGKRHELARYVITYADGQVVKAPIYAEVDVDDFRQTAPADLAGARVAWSKPFAGGAESATAYVKQWTNPRPDVVIVSVGLEYGADRVGTPALLAITAAR